MRRLLITSVGLGLGLGALACSPKEAPPPLVGGWEDGGYGLQIEERPPAGVLWRHEVDAALEEGLGTFLQRVAVEADFNLKGEFRGFRVVALGPRQFWEGVDVALGDVVTQVNGMPIERETEAFAAFESLRGSETLRVTILRDGQARTLQYQIQARSDFGEGDDEAEAEEPEVPSEPADPEPTKGRPPESQPVPSGSAAGAVDSRG